jgi:hypothetical protein
MTEIVLCSIRYEQAGPLQMLPYLQQAIADYLLSPGQAARLFVESLLGNLKVEANAGR